MHCTANNKFYTLPISQIEKGSSKQLEGRSFLNFLLKRNIYFLRTRWPETMAGDQKDMQHTVMSLNQLEITKKEKYLHAIIVL